MPYIGVTLNILPQLTDWVDPDLNPLNVVVDIQRNGAGPWGNLGTVNNNTILPWLVTAPVCTAQIRYSNPLDPVYTVYGDVFAIAVMPAISPTVLESKPIGIAIGIAV